MKPLGPKGISKPLAAYSHGIECRSRRLVVTSGQLPLAPDGTIPDGAYAQAQLCFDNIGKILNEAEMSPANVIRINAYVTHRDHMRGYMDARDDWVPETAVLPASTLVIVSGFTRPEFLVEVEVIASEESCDAAKA